jgi:hypothetical protein
MKKWHVPQVSIKIHGIALAVVGGLNIARMCRASISTSLMFAMIEGRRACAFAGQHLDGSINGGRATCESCTSIDVRQWHRQGRLL